MRNGMRNYQAQRNRWHKMKFSGFVLLFLALFFKVSVSVDSWTQVLMFELEIESSAKDNVTDLFTKNIPVSPSVTIAQIKPTTDCDVNSLNMSCSCVQNNTWTSDICTNCCKNNTCTLNVTDNALCLSEKRVKISGSVIMPYDYSDLFDQTNKPTKYYEEYKKNITQYLTENFSTINWFSSVIITGFGRGSLIVNFEVQIFDEVDLTQLENIATILPEAKLVTTGVVTFIGPQHTVDINSNVDISCGTKEALGKVEWFLKNTAQNEMTVITNGNEATLSENGLQSTVKLKNISGSWKGIFVCEYVRKSIRHTASGYLDIALLPNDIRIISDPQFPDCRTETKVKVEIKCEISNNTENYEVTWDSPQLKDLIIQEKEMQGNKIYYKADANIQCKNMNVINVTCMFNNTRASVNKQKIMTVEIPIIKTDSKVCQAEYPWPTAVSNYTAIQLCGSDSVGEKTRKCIDEKWENEISKCVDLKLHNIQYDVEELMKGIGLVKEKANIIFFELQSTTRVTSNSYANVNQSVDILAGMNTVSIQQSNQWNHTVMSDIVNTASNLLTADNESWTIDNNFSLTVKYLQTIERMINNTHNLTSDKTYESENVLLLTCNGISVKCDAFNASVYTKNHVVVTGFKNLSQLLPTTFKTENYNSQTTILSVTLVEQANSSISVKMTFDDAINRRPNHEMVCVFWDENQKAWSDDGCQWAGANNPKVCICNHNSAFTILMSKNAESLPYMEEITYCGLGISIISLALCLLIEFLVWDAVVKSNISNFRHIALVNISLFLLLAHCSFLASVKPEDTPQNWCLILTVVKHFCFLAVFFWMLCLGFVLLHQIIFVFNQLQKKVYLGLSITVGYVCPLIVVAATVITFENGKDGEYYSRDTCWLLYKGMLKGSMFAFIIPVGVIVFINMFTLVVVIIKIVTPTVSEAKARDEKEVARSIMKTIVFLTPVMGITWAFGFFMLTVDFTTMPAAYFVYYPFTIVNSLQGFFILVTNCFGEKKVRDALLKRFRGKDLVNFKSESSTKETSSVIKN